MEYIQRCTCCKTCKDCPEFQKVINVPNAGLVVYRYPTFTEDVKNTLTGEHEKSKAVIILHNTKNVDIISDNLISKIDDCKKCPRCKYILEQTQKLLHKVPTLKKFDVLGLCDRCRTKERTGISCCKCNDAVQKFIAMKVNKTIEQIQTTSKTQNLPHMQQLLNDLVKKNEQYKILNRTRSESFLNNLCHRTSQEIHEPQVIQLFEPKKELHDVSLKSKLGRKRLYMSLQKYEITSQEHLDSETYEQIRNMKPFERSTKKNTGHPIRPISISEYSIASDLHDVKNRASILQSSRSSEQYKKNLHFPKFHKIPCNMKDEGFLHLKKHSSIWKLESEHSPMNEDNIKKERPQSERKTTARIRKSISDSRLNKEIGMIEKKIKLIEPLFLNACKYNSEEGLFSSNVTEKKECLFKDFSFFFIHETDHVTKPIQKRKSSIELIKETQAMLRKRKEELNKEKEDELKRKQDEKKTTSRKESVKFMNEKKRILREEKEKTALEVYMNEKGLCEDQHIKYKGSKKTSIKEKVGRDTRTPSVKTKKTTTNIELKINKNAEYEAKKVHKEKEKLEKIKLEKERKLKDKDKTKREKEEQLQRAKEEKEKLKMEKEELTRKAKEKEQLAGKANEKEELTRKAKDKEEYSRKQKDQLNKEKQEQLRPEKEVKDKYKEKDVQKKEVDEKQRKQEERREQILQTDDENYTIKRLIDKKTKDYTESKVEPLKESEIKGTHERKPELPKSKELNINQVKIRKPSTDDLIMQLVKLKQSEVAQPRERPKRLSQVNIPVQVLIEHKEMHRGLKLPACVICNDSELELDIEDLMLDKNKSTIGDVVIRSQIYKYKPLIIEKGHKEQTVPLLFTSTFKDDIVNVPGKNNPKNKPVQKERNVVSLTSGKYPEQEVPKGVIRYALSDRTFIDKGWTMLPTEKVVRKMNVYRMRPAHPEFDWFEHNKNKKIMNYDSGEKLAEFDDNGRGRLYYKSGRLALNYYDAEEINVQQRFVIHSSGELDERGRSHPLAILATFDYLGNGIVFDHSGKIRLKYNQTEGVVLDRNIGPVSHWKWHTLNDPPVLQQVMIDTQMAHKDPDILMLGGPADNKMRPDNEEMLAIEFDNFIKEKSKKLSQKFKPFQIKMKAIKINEHFSLKVLDQATVYLIFRDGSTNLKLNIGMILDHQEIVDTDTAEVGDVSNSLERFPARTDSLAGLQKSVAYAQRVERARVERERRLRVRPTQPCPSSDKLIAAASKPLRTTLRTVPSNTTIVTGVCRCRCGKPPPTNLYYDTRLI